MFIICFTNLAPQVLIFLVRPDFVLQEIRVLKPFPIFSHRFFPAFTAFCAVRENSFFFRSVPMPSKRLDYVCRGNASTVKCLQNVQEVARRTVLTYSTVQFDAGQRLNFSLENDTVIDAACSRVHATFFNLEMKAITPLSFGLPLHFRQEK